ncbi:MAG: cobalamin-dependent protein [Candidatus Latescibacterota bacterium]|nr:MAG: cobalamin-dependent protein [Candidatus Latescibacterota bacterium]
MNNNDKDLTPRHPIGVVANRSGVSQDLLRAWERRYGAVTPGRTETGRRLYSDRDIARLILLRRLISAGRRISDVAGLGIQELEALVKEDRDATQVGSPRTDAGALDLGGERHLEAALDAVDRYDSDALQRTLAVAALTMGPAALRHELIVPLLREIGDRWIDGEIRVVQEHMATAIVKSFLESSRVPAIGNARPKIAVTTPAGQLHELGALMAAAVAEEAGWNVVYLGANLPAEEIGAGAVELGVGAVAISLVYVEDADAAAEEIRTIRRHIGPQIPLLIGGWGAASIADAIDEAGGVIVADLDDLRDQLDRIRD